MNGRYFYILFLIIVLFSCSKQEEPKKEEINAMYYWRTVFELSSEEKSFLKEHNVQKLYVRLFDVVWKEREREAEPNATITFKKPFPSSLEIIPVVFITNDCMKNIQDSCLADKVFERISQMILTHRIRNVKEIQIDCDWTKNSEKNYMNFMNRLHSLTNNYGITLSTTVRCYQLSWQVPKADKGVLMMYNTGDIRSKDDKKPILDVDKLGGYLKYLKNYNLPLSVAYPIFKYDILFRNDKFVGIVNYENDMSFFDDDTIVRREPAMKDIFKTKKRLQEIRKNIHNEIILFDLSDSNIYRYEKQDYKTLFSH